MRVPVVPHLGQLWVLSVFSILAILMGLRWYFIVILICTSHMTNELKCLFVCLLASWISSVFKMVVTKMLIRNLFIHSTNIYRVTGKNDSFYSEYEVRFWVESCIGPYWAIGKPFWAARGPTTPREDQNWISDRKLLK